MRAISSRWHVKEIIRVALISILIGGIFVFSDWIYTILSGLLAATGFSPFVTEVLFGLWAMGGSIAFMVVRLPGAPVFGEIIGAIVEGITGGQFGLFPLVLSGFLQGIGTDLGFACFKYRRFTISSLTLAAVFTTIITFSSAVFVNGYIKLGPLMVFALFLTRLISNLIFCVGVVSLIYRLLLKANVVQTPVNEKVGK